MRNIIFVSFLLLWVGVNAQNKTASIAKLARPKLVVGIVIDQMRWDYLYRYADRYSPNGFKRLLNDGFSCENTFIPYTPTVTAAGHTCVYTGSVPAIHGILGNSWYRRDLNRSWYCTEDSTVKTVGSTSDAGEMSPSSMWTTTVTDELRLATNFRSKVIGIALKDRGAILPAGHSANGAYWFDNANGAFISSTYYMKDLPDWVKQFNNKKLPDQYLQQNWNTLYPINTYVQSTADDKTYEGSLEDNTFPHITANITRDKYNALRTTPSGNTLTFEMAKAAIEGERLGQTANTDFLAVSFSSPDYIGHTFGPNSIEVEDNYLRLDNELAQFLNFLDGKIGKGQYTVFITADHAVAHVPDQLKENKIPAGLLGETGLQSTLNNMIEQRFKIKNAVSSVSNYQVYLNKAVIENEQKIKEAIIDRLLEFPIIVNAFDVRELNKIALPVGIKNMVANGYNQKLSGDIQFIYKPQYFSGGNKGTTHGSWNPYDSHIPLLWYGWGIKKGKTNRETYMTDISPTLSALLHIQMPSGNIGQVIEEVIQ
ncbi:alkaline phosphatase PafA [Segetibacter sp.]|uniref:alkaline phosphatase PafA n=1 Tax=Segetibacter sp. TaxID=2231182 RepID=UPI0026392F0D|nr:alkaline phosphatase PafA [Segetibacter sp.]MCW3081458.1 nucleotide pyrophosphatase [Segetibacter sp.]